MKTIEKITNEWQAMLSRGTMPLFEFELKNDEYLIVDIELNADKEAFIFSFDSMDLKTWFSGNVKMVHDCKFSFPLDDYFDNLDYYFQEIYMEVLEGFIIPNNLLPREEE